jgi:hypothetical protein
MSALPLLTHKIYKTLLEAKATRSIPGYNGNLPEIWRYNGSPAAMDEESWEEWKEEYIKYSVFCSKVWGREQSEEDAEKFAKLAYESPVSPISKRTSE